MSISMTRKLLRPSPAVLLTLTGAIHGALAGTSTGTMAVTSSVAAVCVIGSANLSFGTYNPTALLGTTSTTTVTLTCSLGTPFNIGMNAGSGAGANTTVRVMTATSGTLAYGIFRDAAYTLNWGNTVGTDTLSGTSSASSLTNTINIYAIIPALENAAIGSYTDSVVMTVTY